MTLLLALVGAAHAAFQAHSALVLENLALRKQVALLRRQSKRPRFGLLDRAFWVSLSRWWAGWREALHVVRPETVIRWHREGFRAFWTWKSRRGRTGRPPVSAELAELVRTRRSPIPSGARRASTVRYSSWGSRFRSVPLPGSCRVGRSPFAERVIGTIRRELLDHVIVLNEGHLRQRLVSYLGYYHGSRTHLALDKDAPEPRTVELPEQGHVVALPRVGGLHHRYVRRAA